MKTGIVSRITDGSFRYQGWPTVCADENGRIYVASSSHRLGHICPFGKDYMYVSDDCGETWSVPAVINDTSYDDRDAGIVALGGGRMLMTWFNHPRKFYLARREKLVQSAGENAPLMDGMMKIWENLPDEADECGSFVRLSEDGGKTWGEAIKVPVTSPHGPALLRDGRLLYVGKEFLSGDPSLEPGSIYAFESRDGGRTWEKLSRIEFAEGCGSANYHEPHALELADGSILAAIRVQGIKDTPDFTVHLCRSYDGGRTWTSPEATGIFGSPPHLLQLPSGEIVMTYGRRTAPFGERAAISRDGGKTFGDERVISEESYSADLGYPSSVCLPDGSVLTVYYQRYGNDKYDSVLYTKWKV